MEISLKTIFDVPTQVLFDHCVNHLLTQGKRSYGQHPLHEEGSTGCLYRMNEGGEVLKCVAGACILDSEYSADIEGTDIVAVIADFYEDNGLSMPDYLSNSNPRLLLALQSIHDGVVPELWADRLQQAAREWSLAWNYKGASHVESN